jgi:hypothetical protein
VPQQSKQSRNPRNIKTNVRAKRRCMFTTRNRSRARSGRLWSRYEGKPPLIALGEILDREVIIDLTDFGIPFGRSAGEKLPVYNVLAHYEDIADDLVAAAENADFDLMGTPWADGFSSDDPCDDYPAGDDYLDDAYRDSYYELVLDGTAAGRRFGRSTPWDDLDEDFPRAPLGYSRNSRILI